MTRETVAETVYAVVCSAFCLERWKVSEATTFVELGLDAQEEVALMLELEREFNIPIDDEDWFLVYSVGDAIERLCVMLGGSSEPEKVTAVHLRRHERLSAALGIDPGYSADATADEAIRQLAALEQALSQIADPIAWLQAEAEREGKVLNGGAAVAVSNDAGWLRSIARKALAARAAGSPGRTDTKTEKDDA